MAQRHERRSSPNPYIDTVWQSFALSDGVYLATPDGSWDLIVDTKADGTRSVYVTGQVTKPVRLPYKAGELSIVISFATGAYLSFLRGAPFVDSFSMLPMPDDEHFVLDGQVFALPTYETAEQLVDELVSCGLLARDEIVEGVLQRAPKAASVRSVQRHFKETTGLSPKKLADIRRAQHAVRLLQHGQDPASTASDAGYYDQPHLAKELKRLMDSKPRDVDDVNQV